MGVTRGAAGEEMSRGGISRGGRGWDLEKARVFGGGSLRTLLSDLFCLLSERRAQNISGWFKGPTLLSLCFLTSKGRSVRMTCPAMSAW